jgi:aldose 1-epimerase
MKASETQVGRSNDGHRVVRYTLENSRGISVSAVSYGASLLSVMVPDARGRTENVTLAHASVDEYRENKAFFGCIVGRFANRIASGRFTLDGRQYSLACNDGPNHLHGGPRGFDKVVWPGKLFRTRDRAGIRWRWTSPDGDQGFPGKLKVTAEYTLTEYNELSFEYWAVTDAPTPVNITNHSYWNLAGSGSTSALSHELSFNCPFYLPVNSGLVPTGEVAGTGGTPFDFSVAKPIGLDIGAVPGGYDHCLVIGKNADSLGLVCTARDPSSGRTMQVWTTKPGLQFYTGNFLDGRPNPKHAGFCVETQYFPDSVNRGHFPSCILRPGETYHQLTRHVFSAGT